MRKNIMFFLLGCVAMSSISIAYAWTGPSTSPPNGNVAAPLHVGSATQVKDGILGLDGLSVFGNIYVESRIGVGTQSPAAQLDITGEIKISSSGAPCTSTTEGSLRYNSTSHKPEFCNGSAWTEMVSSETNSTPSPQHGSQIFESSGTWTVPAGITSVKVTAIGGGGGSHNCGGPVGGNGGAGSSYVTVTPGSNIAVGVGTGGGALCGWGAGGTGGSSTFGSAVTASGGTGAYGYPSLYNNNWGGGTDGSYTSSGTQVLILPSLRSLYNKGNAQPEAGTGQDGIVILEY